MRAIRALASSEEAAAVLERFAERGYCEVGNTVMLSEYCSEESRAMLARTRGGEPPLGATAR
jgi:hypothetical protein